MSAYIDIATLLPTRNVSKYWYCNFATYLQEMSANIDISTLLNTRNVSKYWYINLANYNKRQQILIYQLCYIQEMSANTDISTLLYPFPKLACSLAGEDMGWRNYATRWVSGPNFSSFLHLCSCSFCSNSTSQHMQPNNQTKQLIKNIQLN